MAQELSIERGTIDNMLRDRRFLSAFPFLKQAKAQIARRSCGGCGGRSRRTSKPPYNQIKRQLANMPTEKKKRLKQLLGAECIRIKFRRPENHTDVVRKF